MVRLKRAYETVAPSDGYRILVERLWPRGVRKEEAALDVWLKDVAPSDELRRWFGHDPSRWAEFQRRYARELRAETAQELLDEIARRAKRGTVTLVYSAHDEQHNNAVVLEQEIRRRLGRAGSAGARPERHRTRAAAAHR